LEKYGETGQATDDNIGPNAAHALRTLDNWGYWHTLRTCNIYCFFTAAMVAGTRLVGTVLRTLLFLFEP